MRITGERRVESVSNRLELYAPCGRKREELDSASRYSPNLSGISASLGRFSGLWDLSAEQVPA